MKVAVYIRVSTDEQAQQGYSIDAQKDRLISFCESQGWDDYQLYIDEGYTGTNLNRPAFKRLIRHIQEGKVQLVLVYKLDRLSRKQLDVLHILEEVFEPHNVAFKSATEPFDTSTPLGKAMIGILAVFAQLERDMIIERTTFGRRQRFSQGEWYGGQVPFGYTWNKEQQVLEVCPEEAWIVKEIYRQYLEGKSRLAIAEWAASRSSARVFDHGIIRDILQRPLYLGKLVNNGEIVDGKHEAIIDPDTWYAVQREWERRKDGQSPTGEYLLTGLLECGICGSGVVHVRRKKTTTKNTYLYELYACKNQHVRPKERSTELRCWLGYKRRSDVEAFVIDQVKQIALNPQKAKRLVEGTTEESGEATAVLALKEKLDQVLSGLENLYDAIQSGEIKASAVSARIRKLEEEREKIELQLDDILDNEPAAVPQEDIRLALKHIGEAWDYLTLDEQKMLLRKVVKKVTLTKSDPIIHWNENG